MTTETTELTVFDLEANTPTTIIEFSVNDYRSAKYFVQGSAGSEHQTSELFIIQDNINSYMREVDLIYTRDPFIRFSSQLTNNTVRILANTSIQNTDIVIYGIQLEVADKSFVSTEISQDKILENSATMQGLYPEDTTDYITEQAGSLYRPYLVENLNREIDDMLTLLNSEMFMGLSESAQKAMINNVADAINNRVQEIQDSIDSDLAAFDSVKSQIEAGSIMTNITESYSVDPNAKALLDMTLNTEVIEELEAQPETNEDTGEPTFVYGKQLYPQTDVVEE